VVTWWSQTWGGIAIHNAGFRNASRALKFALGWGLATAERGCEPESVEQYAEMMGESRATAFRDQQAFRRAFPGHESPAEINRESGLQERYDALWEKLGNRKRMIQEAQPLMFALGAARAA